MKRALSGTLTVRISVALERRLERTSKKRGKRPSELVREFIEDGLKQSDESEQPTAAELVGHLFGSISSSKVPAGRDASAALAQAVRNRRG